ncbi:hemerythrin domain-containing protein [Actinokineospora sp. PR83]|uniref:hemerythrin domain-containing protein n=1 Tax=Actinokineospora sp. PR83 TaxID=2884908 RepID=UPI001F3AD173|nr:hemerythrin domain-containing protein [Actinokineospora sp. PR83]MCG8915138.1 hemerythrin domain-containing protein [Actinokineospora sp. PR83]
MTAGLSSEHGLDGLPENLHGFALLHRAMRRDAKKLLAVAPKLSSPKRPRVASWWDQVRATIDWHHHTEDDILWPELRAKVPGFAEREVDMHADHAALDEAMDAVTAALRLDDNAALVEAATRFDAIIHDHLRAEETIVLPAFVAMGKRAYGNVERRIMFSAPPTVLAFLLPWMFDGAGSGRAAALMPLPVRLIGLTALNFRYERSYRWW